MVGVPMMPSLMLPIDPLVLLPMILSGAAFVKVHFSLSHTFIIQGYMMGNLHDPIGHPGGLFGPSSKGHGYGSGYGAYGHRRLTTYRPLYYHYRT